MKKIVYNINKGGKYFSNNYNVVYSNFSNDSQCIDDKNNTCRFCKKSNNQTTFKTKCHAIPEFFGNKEVFTKNECDDCNHKYGKILENELSKMTGPYRTITSVRGKKGIPIYKDSQNQNRCEFTDNTLKINMKKNIVKINSNSKKLVLKLGTQGYIPLSAYKCFVRVALNCMPLKEFNKFKMIQWLEDNNYKYDETKFYAKILFGFSRINVQNECKIVIFIRKQEIKNVPYCQMVIQSNRLFYQIVIPFIDEDASLEDNVIIEPFWNEIGIDDLIEKNFEIELYGKEKEKMNSYFYFNYKNIVM